jgi:hypothetical protein
MNSLLANPYLSAAGLATAIAALLHLMVPLGGPAWYAFFGAPQRLVRMAEAGALHPVVSCVVIAALLCVCSAYAFSGAGLLPPLPLLRLGLTGMAAVFLLRGVGFIALEWLRPGSLTRISGSQGIDTFLVVSSLVCLLIGLAYALGLISIWGHPGR